MQLTPERAERVIEAVKDSVKYWKHALAVAQKERPLDTDMLMFGTDRLNASASLLKELEGLKAAPPQS